MVAVVEAVELREDDPAGRRATIQKPAATESDPTAAIRTATTRATAVGGGEHATAKRVVGEVAWKAGAARGPAEMARAPGSGCIADRNRLLALAYRSFHRFLPARHTPDD